MKTKQSFLESAEFDEFFRQGDEPARPCDSIQPVVGVAHVADDAQSEFIVRTPEQQARRAKFVRMVSVTMAVLSVASAGAFAVKLWPASDHTGLRFTETARIATPNPQRHQSAIPEFETATRAEEGRKATATLPGAGPSEPDASAAPNNPNVVAAPTAAASTQPINAHPVKVIRHRSAQSSSSRQAAVPRVSASKAPEPKPEGYHPPTASFSD